MRTIREILTSIMAAAMDDRARCSQAGFLTLRAEMITRCLRRLARPAKNVAAIGRPRNSGSLQERDQLGGEIGQILN